MTVKKYSLYLIAYIIAWHLLHHLVSSTFSNYPRPEGIWDVPAPIVLMFFIRALGLYLIPFFLICIPLKAKKLYLFSSTFMILAIFSIVVTYESLLKGIYEVFLTLLGLYYFIFLGCFALKYLWVKFIKN